eukprot:5744291-Pyramimonas_sp.AAC.1
MVRATKLVASVGMAHLCLHPRQRRLQPRPVAHVHALEVHPALGGPARRELFVGGQVPRRLLRQRGD